MDESMDDFYAGINTRVQERIGSMGLSAAARDAKLAKYAELFEGEDVRLSALSIQNIATDLMTTYHWVITGEHEPLEMRTTIRNILKDGDGTSANPDWLMADDALRDLDIVYRQVAPFREPLEAFNSLQAGNVNFALADLKQELRTNPALDFFEAIEKFFGVEVIVLESEHAFDAIGAVSGDHAFILANSNHSPARVFYAVICELAMISTNTLALYSDVFDEDFPANTTIGELMDELITAFLSYSAKRDEPSVPARRFPAGLVEAHREAVAKHGNLGFFLEWMTGEKRVQEDLPPTNVEDLVDWFGFKDK